LPYFSVSIGIAINKLIIKIGRRIFHE